MAITDLVLGTMYVGTRLDDAASFRLLDRFVDAGGVTVDTANCYSFWESPTGHGGQSESTIGRWIAANPGVRKRIFLATKVGAEPAGDREEGLAAAVVARATDASLERLGVDAVDLLWAHVEDRTTPLEETAGALRAEWEAGRTGAIGVSNHATWRLERLRAALESGGGPALKAGGGPALKAGGGPALAALQYRYSYLQPRPGIQAEGQANRMGYLSADVRDFAAETGAEVWAYTSLLQGSYDRHDRPFPPSYHHEGNEARLAVLAEVAQEVGHTRGEVVLAWLIAHGIRPILGGSTIPQLESALRGAALELAPEQVGRLDAAG